MKTTLISCANRSCGIGRYSEELSSALVHRGSQISLLRKDQSQLPHIHTYPYRSFRQFRHYVAPFYLSRELGNHTPDVWHADYVDSAFALAFSRNHAHIPLITTVHDAIPFMYRSSGSAFMFYRLQLNFAARRSHKLIVVSYQSKIDLMKYAGISAEKIEVVYNGINHERFQPLKTKENEKFIIRYVGGLGGPYKNVETLLHMAARLEAWNLDFRLEIAGAHPENTSLPSLAHLLGLKNVQFKGFISDEALPEFLANADLFVYPSKYEGFGFPPLEAMACGTATVASKLGSLSEVLSFGAITTYPDADSLAKAVASVYNNPNLRASLEHRGKIVAEKYTWQKTASRMEQIYEDALSKNSISSRVA